MAHNENLSDMQKALREMKIDGWLFYSFRGSDPFAGRILGLEEKGVVTRRWFYYLPNRGMPQKVVHIIEKDKLDELPGDRLIYLSWKELHDRLRGILSGGKKIAMQYSPLNAIPYVSCVDGGTIELIRSFGCDVVSSADLIGRFEARLSPEQAESHRYAALALREIVDQSFGEIARRLRDRVEMTEFDIQQFIAERFKERSLVTHDLPVVAVNEHTANPHYEPQDGSSSAIREGDLILLDIWAKKEAPHAVYGDITWTAFAGSAVPGRPQEIFQIVRKARDGALSFVREALSANRPLHGWEIDDVARGVIEHAGYGKYFIHRTGHSIGEEVHGTGVNIDNLETQDDRLIHPGSCFSLEPGIYLEGDFGIRSEIDVYIERNEAMVFGEPLQEAIVPLLA
jgi:Xaa-Pro dipeptidase